MDFSALFSPAVITSAGGIVLAILLAFFLYKFAGNHVDHNTKAMNGLSQNTTANTEVLRNLTDVIKDLRSDVRSNK